MAGVVLAEGDEAVSAPPGTGTPLATTVGGGTTSRGRARSTTEAGEHAGQQGHESQGRHPTPAGVEAAGAPAVQHRTRRRLRRNVRPPDLVISARCGPRSRQLPLLLAVVPDLLGVPGLALGPGRVPSCRRLPGRLGTRPRRPRRRVCTARRLPARPRRPRRPVPTARRLPARPRSEALRRRPVRLVRTPGAPRRPGRCWVRPGQPRPLADGRLPGPRRGLHVRPRDDGWRVLRRRHHRHAVDRLGCAYGSCRLDLHRRRLDARRTWSSGGMAARSAAGPPATSGEAAHSQVRLTPSSTGWLRWRHLGRARVRDCAATRA